MKDLARIYVKAGDGGDGSVHFRHEKYAPKGGPDGGDGGKGGDVILVADENIDSLVEFNFKKRFIANSGGNGLGKNMYGAKAEDLVVRLPVGTVVWEVPEELAEANIRERATFEHFMTTRRLLVDMTENGKTFTAVWGGKGGRGNYHFRSATNQTPMEHDEGQPGEEKWLLLELKVVADVGIIGLPNVGKSSLLKALTRANPKIAGYPFTTLEPNLGVTTTGDKHTVLVDVPGVIEEAWEGKGIGPWFLRHLERCKTLVHVLAPAINEQMNEQTSERLVEQLVHDYVVVRKELEKYGQGLPEKKEIVVVNKKELVEEKDRQAIEMMFTKETGKDVVWVSAASNEVGELTTLL